MALSDLTVRKFLTGQQISRLCEGKLPLARRYWHRVPLHLFIIHNDILKTVHIADTDRNSQ